MANSPRSSCLRTLNCGRKTGLRMSPVGEFGLARSNKTAALLVTVKGKSLCDGLWPPLTVTASGGPAKPVGTRRWSLVDRTRRWNDLRSALTLIAPYKSFDPEQTFPCGDTDGALFAQQALTPAQADAQECS